MKISMIYIKYKVFTVIVTYTTCTNDYSLFSIFNLTEGLFGISSYTCISIFYIHIKMLTLKKYTVNPKIW